MIKSIVLVKPEKIYFCHYKRVLETESFMKKRSSFWLMVLETGKGKSRWPQALLLLQTTQLRTEQVCVDVTKLKMENYFIITHTRGTNSLPRE